MIYHGLIRQEKEQIEEACNFTGQELQLFRMRASGESLERCAELMNVSVATVKRISQRVNRKIKKLILF